MEGVIGNVIECEKKGLTRMPEYCWSFKLSEEGFRGIVRDVIEDKREKR